MNRPQSIMLFDKVFLAAIAASLLGIVLFYDANLRALQAEAAIAEAGFGSGLLLGITAVSLGIMLLLWYFISRRASSLAKWLLVGLTIIGLPSSISGLMTASGLQLVLTAAVLVLQILAIVLLFRADARAWFQAKGQAPVNAATFD